MKKKDREILNEKVKRYQQILEYSFIKNGDTDRYDELYGMTIDEDDEEPNDFDEIPSDGENSMIDSGEDELGQDTQGMNQQPQIQPQATDQTQGNGEVELDVTQLVNGTDEVKMTAELGLKKMEDLLLQFKELETKLSGMENISNKIDSLEKEIAERNPKPIEKLQMRSLDSFPYNVKLTDYWKDVKGYDPNGDEDEAEKEYVLKQDDIENEYSDSEIKNSFNDYEEEDF